MTERLRPLLAALRRIGFFLGRINGFLLLTFSYYVLLTPLAVLRRILRRRPEDRGWSPRDPLPRDHYEKQY